MPEIVFAYSPFWIGLIIILSGLVSFYLYRKDEILREQSKYLPLLLGIARFISLALIAFFLLEPMIKKEEKDVQEAIIALVVDNSESILNSKDSLYYKSDFAQDIQSLTNSLSESYRVDNYSFSENIDEGLNIDFSGKKTDLSKVMEGLESRYYNRNLAAIILASDGNYNEGKNPFYMPKVLDAPLYSILMGDTGSISDAGIEEIILNKNAFLGDLFPVELNYSALNLGGNDYTLLIRHRGRVIEEIKGTFENENFFRSELLKIEAEEVGLQRYTVELRADAEEELQQNNSASFYINVIDERLKIAILYSSPHPDIAVWNEALSANKNYEVDLIDVDEESININDHACYVLFQLPSSTSHAPLISAIADSKIPFILQVGLKTDLEQGLYNELMRFDILGENMEDYKVALDPGFNIYSIDTEIRDLIPQFAPLSSPMMNASINGNRSVLLNKRIGQLNSDQEVFAFKASFDHKYGLLLGEGLWRWKMTAFAQTESHEVFNEFLQQSIKFLVRNANRSRFNIDIKDAYNEGEKIKAYASLLDASLENAKNATIDLVLINERNEEFRYSFLEKSNSYELDLAALLPGDYSYQASASYGDEQFSRSGSFTVKELLLEQRNTRANSNLLYQLAQKQGGDLYYRDQLKEVQNSIEAADHPAVIYSTERFTDLIRIGPLFFVILLLLSIEWFFRRYFGSY